MITDEEWNDPDFWASICLCLDPMCPDSEMARQIQDRLEQERGS